MYKRYRYPSGDATPGLWRGWTIGYGELPWQAQLRYLYPLSRHCSEIDMAGLAIPLFPVHTEEVWDDPTISAIVVHLQLNPDSI